jgi:hypothetical protein
MEQHMKLLGFALIAAGLLAAASTEAAAGRRIAGPYYVSYPYPYTTHRWGRWYAPYAHWDYWRVTHGRPRHW